eukprot:2416407-Pleurochrysis_carterae.AAC.4
MHPNSSSCCLLQSRVDPSKLALFVLTACRAGCTQRSLLLRASNPSAVLLSRPVPHGPIPLVAR